MKKTDLTYQSYLLRCWRGSAGGRWRASLEPTATAQRYSFSTLGSMVSFLEGTMGEEINIGVAANPDAEGRFM